MAPSGASHAPASPRRPQGTVWQELLSLTDRSPVLAAVGIAVAAKLLALLGVIFIFDFPDDLVERLTGRWDARAYVGIANDGYRLRADESGISPAWPFGYPLLILLAGGTKVAAALINNVASLAAVAVVAQRFGKRWGIALALFPSWIVFGTVSYSEGLYVLLAALALSRPARPLWTGAWSVLAVCTRYLGGPALVVAALPWTRERRRSWRGVLAMLGAVAVLLWVWFWYATGEFFGYAAALKAINDSGFAWPWDHFQWLLRGVFPQQGGGPTEGDWVPVELITRDLCFLAIYGVGLGVLWRRPDSRDLFAYSLFAVVFALCTDGIPATNLPRYLLVGFPAIAALGDRLRGLDAWLAYATIGVSVAIYGFGRFMYGYWA